MDGDSGPQHFRCNDTLGDIHLHLVENSLQRTFGPVKVYLTGCEAVAPHPYRFQYYSCTAVVDNGRLCGRSAVGKKLCPHTALLGSCKKKTYRLDVFFADKCLSENTPPLRAGIFYDAATFLGISVDNFSLLSKLEEHRRVMDSIAHQHWVEVILHSKDRLVTMYDLKMKRNSPVCLNQSFFSSTPTQQRAKHNSTATSPASPSIFLTAKLSLLTSTQSAGALSAPASSSFGSGAGRHGKYKDVRAKLVDLITVIDLSDDE